MFDLEKIKECKIGTVVMYTNHTRGDAVWASDFGHIIGFDINSLGELVLSVKWADEEQTLVHPTNIKIL